MALIKGTALERRLATRLRNLKQAAINVLATSHELQDGQHDTPAGYVLVDKAAVLALNSLICGGPNQ